MQLTTLEAVKVLLHAANDIITDAEQAEQDGVPFKPDISYIVGKVQQIITDLAKEATD